MVASDDYEARARTRQAVLTKPPGSLGRLEELAVQLASIQQTDSPRTRGRSIVIFAADHGVTEEGVSPYPSEVTQQMLMNFAAGGAAINALAKNAEIDLRVVDVGTSPNGTRNFLREPAMSEAKVNDAVQKGVDAVKALRGNVLLGLGEMGIGNTTSASAITSALTGLSPDRVTGAGTGLDEAGVGRKVEVIERALEMHDVSEPLAVLRNVGGLEIAALVGACLEAARMRLAIVVDGFITTAAFAIAWRLKPEIRHFAIFAHRSTEPGHLALLEMMDAAPLLDLGLRLGEGTGAALAMSLLDAAVATHNEMATFESAGVSDRPG